MNRTRCRPLIVLVTGFALASILGCSSAPAASDPTSTRVTTTTSTTTIAPTTTRPPQATRGAPSSAEAAEDLVTAWNGHDRKAAAQIADAPAVEGIFATPDPAMWLRGCTPPDPLPTGGCVYRTRAGLVQINTERRDIGWVVDSANYDEIKDGGLPEHSGDAPDAPPPTTLAPATPSTSPG